MQDMALSHTACRQPVISSNRISRAAGKQGGKKRKLRSPAIEATAPEAACAAFGKVVRYATSERCRRAMLLEHFGERRSEPCQGCDYCQRPLEVSAQVLSPL